MLAAVLALTVLVAPLAAAGTSLPWNAVEADRSFKLTLVENLTRGPQILILGSSRSRQAEPSYLQQLTGHSGFNAGVTGGTAADAWVFTRFVAGRFPHQKRRYIWFVDVGVATNGVNAELARDPRARKYLTGGQAFDVGYAGPYISVAATKGSLQKLRRCLLTSCRAGLTYNPDGSLTHPALDVVPATTRKQAVDRLLAQIGAHRPQRVETLNPKRFVWFERALAFMNTRGEVPVIVLNPIYPSVLALLQRYGFTERRAALAYLQQLHRRFDVVLVDCENIRRWGGTDYDWTDAKHVNRANMRRLLTYVVAHSVGALR